MNKTHFLFSYGTLQQDNVQLESYGRLLNGTPDKLVYYKLSQIDIKNPDVIKKSGKATHPIAIKTGNPLDVINGMVFEISDEELLETDKYEVEEYTRVKEVLSSGKSAWVYVKL